MTGSSRQERLEYFDIARGIGIISVIAGHLGPVWIKSFIFTFHMPLFLLISGWFFHDRAGVIKTYAKRLLEPYCITVGALVVIKTIESIVEGENPLNTILIYILSGLYGNGSESMELFGLTIPYIGAIWFLLAEFWAVILLYLIIKIKYVSFRSLSVVCIFLLGVITASYITLPLSIQPGLASLLFIYIGWEIGGFWEHDFKKGNIQALIICLIIWACAIVASYLNSYLSIVRCAFPNGLLDIVGALAASWLIIVLSTYIERTHVIAGILEFWGKNSLLILCLHLIESKCIPWNIIYDHVSIYLLALAIVFICKVLFATVGVILINRIKNGKLEKKDGQY